MKILAIIIPASDRHGDSFVHFPLGMSYILGSIRNKLPNAELRLLDFNVEIGKNPEDIHNLRKHIIQHKDYKPDYILYGGMVTRYQFCKKVSSICREEFSDAIQVVGGSVAATAYQAIGANSSVDFLVIGEGEETVVELLKVGLDRGSTLLQRKKISGIEGIAYRKNDKKSLKLNLSRDRINNLNSIPMPAYDLFDMEFYIASNFVQTGWRFLPLIGSRGCPFSCNFCYKNFGSKVTYRSPKLVVEEIKHLKDKYNIDSFYLWDETQFLNKDWMREFAKELLNNSNDLKYTLVSRVTLFKKEETDDDLELLELCKKSGLLRIAVGIESGSQRILDAMNKKSTVEQIEHTIRLIRAAGLKATGSMLLGYPGETQESVQESVNFANRNLLQTSFYNVIPMPGTTLYDHCVKKNIIENEDAYLEMISEHGDASHIYVNLTEMSDDEYREASAFANKSVSRSPMMSYLHYYGITGGFKNIFVDIIKNLKRIMNGRMFETP